MRRDAYSARVEIHVPRTLFGSPLFVCLQPESMQELFRLLIRLMWGRGRGGDVRGYGRASVRRVDAVRFLMLKRSFLVAMRRNGL